MPKNDKKFVYPDLIFNGIVLFYVLMALLISLAILKPFGLGEVADPLKAPSIIKPEWYFLAFFQFINYLPKGVGAGLVFLGVILFCLWPFFPGVRVRDNEKKSRHAFLRAAGIVFVVLYLLLALAGYLSETERKVFGKNVYFDTKGVPRQVKSSEKAATPAGQDTSSSEKARTPVGQDSSSSEKTVAPAGQDTSSSEKTVAPAG